MAGYAVVLASWALARFGPARLADWARVALLAGAVAGVGFSVYLTFLEPFVIGATCMWCLASAVIVTGLMWLTARPGAGGVAAAAGPPPRQRERAGGEGVRRVLRQRERAGVRVSAGSRGSGRGRG